MTKETSFYLNILKEYGLYLAIFFILFVLTFRVISPQFESFNENRTKLDLINTRLKGLTSKIKTLESMDKNQVQNDLKKLNLALPSEKEPGTMLGALDFIAARSGSRLGSFSLSVGSLEESSKSAVTNPRIGVPLLTVNVSVRGTLSNVERFITELNNILPVMQVSKLSYASSGISTITLIFYYKPVASSIRTSVDTPLPQIGNKESILEKLSKRQTLPVAADTVATSSAGKDLFR